MKKLGLNALVLNKESGGLGTYLNNLIEYLRSGSFDFEPIIFLPDDTYVSNNQFKNEGIFKKVKVQSNKAINRVVREKYLWPKLIKEHKIDLLHSPISYIPWGVNIPSIITIHDLGFFHFPQNYTLLRRLFLERIIKVSVEKAIKVITISEFTKKDIINTFNINPDKISVVYEGIDKKKYQKRASPQKAETVTDKYNLSDKYILSVGHLEPRKNYMRLIKAFELIKRNHNLPHKLVIIGRENWKYKKIFELINELDLKDQIVLTGFVSEDDLITIYQKADVFVTASIFEGFGFTPLEAMAAGTPVAASNATSIPEVVGNATNLFDPFDVDDITDKTYKVICSDQLRKELVQKGYQNLKRFDWKECCKKTVQEYENVLREL